MTTRPSTVRLTPAQRVALERVRDERIYRFGSSGKYWTPGSKKRAPRRDVLDKLRTLGLACNQYDGAHKQGIRQMVIDAGFWALEASK